MSVRVMPLPWRILISRNAVFAFSRGVDAGIKGRMSFDGTTCVCVLCFML